MNGSTDLSVALVQTGSPGVFNAPVPHWHCCGEALWKWANCCSGVATVTSLLRNSALYTACVVPAKIIFKVSSIIVRDA